jgi:Amt family ammonium transporter
MTDDLAVLDATAQAALVRDGKQIIAQIIEVGAGTAWNVVVGGIVFFVIGKVLGSNRVSAEVEIAGLDVPEMGAAGYPEFVATKSPEEVPPGEVAAAMAARA